MRYDLSLIQDWVSPKSRVLDLGCGDGALLEALRDQQQVNGLGVEIDADNINNCLRRGLNVIEHDLNRGLGNFRDNSFDAVIMAQSLQALDNPREAVLEMLRVGRECIVAFPNFGNAHNRIQVLLQGRMPVSEHLPYNWYDTPNIHFFTIRDFEQLCLDEGIAIRNRAMFNASDSPSFLARLWPNMFATTAIYHISRQA